MHKHIHDKLWQKLVIKLLRQNDIYSSIKGEKTKLRMADDVRLRIKNKNEYTVNKLNLNIGLIASLYFRGKNFTCLPRQNKLNQCLLETAICPLFFSLRFGLVWKNILRISANCIVCQSFCYSFRIFVSFSFVIFYKRRGYWYFVSFPWFFR